MIPRQRRKRTERKRLEQQRRWELQAQLVTAREDRRAVAQEGRAAKPLLEKLQKHLQDNNFAERLAQSIDATRRRTT